MSADSTATADEPSLIVERRGRMAVLWMNRPKALNAMTASMMGALNRAVAAAEADPDVMAIVITGKGRGFCGGFDSSELSEATETGNRRLEERGMDPALPAQFASFLKISKPMIAAVNGPAAGLGFILAMMCDLRFAAPEAVFVTAFSQRGLVAEHGTSWLLPRLLGTGRALDLLWSSRKVSGEEAYRLGFADRLVPATELIDAVGAYVDHLAATTSPRSLALIKDMVYRHLGESFANAVRDADKIATGCLDHPDSREGVRSFIERRPPQFAPWTGKES